MSKTKSTSNSQSEYNYGENKEFVATNKKIAKCLRQVANITTVKPNMLLDTSSFNPKLLKAYLPTAAPKISKLLEKIAALDAKDKETEAKYFKHVIFTDVLNSKYGAKIVASAFMSHDYKPVWNGMKLKMKSDEELNESRNKNFGLLLSKPFAKATMPVKFKKAQVQLFNTRPDNIHGELVRFMILDQGFKEGIDMFDVKYIHILEPLVSAADETQVIGRGTRLCGQKGLQFHPKYGWPLYVYRYDVDITGSQMYEKTLFELFMKYNGVDLRRLVFATELDKIVVDAAVDKPLTTEVHLFEVEKPPPIQHGGELNGLLPPRRKMILSRMHQFVASNFSKFQYPKVKLENLCEEKKGGGGKDYKDNEDEDEDESQDGGAGWSRVNYTPTQDFVRHFFQPESPYKGMLLYHSVGTGKLCSGIAVASSTFEKQDYTILWVTRHTLKADVWKNMFGQVCSQTVLDRVDSGELKLPVKSSPVRYLSEKWIEPISYKQFSNLLLKNNKYYTDLEKRNGKADPLRKTLVVIDEAHKLYADNVSAAERPNIEILEKMIHDSYKKSGKDSVRVLLMTATPYTNDGMEMIKLLNLLREDPLPVDFDAFSKLYLQTDGTFSPKGRTRFQNDVSGYVSYLNRSQDARTFAHPVIQNVFVPMSMGESKATKHIDQQIKDISAQIKELRASGKNSKCDKINSKSNTIGDCKENVKEEYDQMVEAARKRKDDGLEDCKDRPVRERKECKDNVNERYKADMERAKEFKAEGMKACKEAKKSQKAVCEKDSVKEQIKELKAQKEALKDKLATVRVIAKENKPKLAELKDEIKQLKESIEPLKERAKALRAKIKAMKAKKNPADNKTLAKMEEDLKELADRAKDMKAEYDTKRSDATKLKGDQKAENIEVGRGAIGKVSQEIMIQKCLAKGESDSNSYSQASSRYSEEED